jgi:hypothetical protein
VDFDISEFREPLRRLCELILQADFTPFYRRTLRQGIIGRATNRLSIEKGLRSDPDILTEPITAPWFVTGLPRTGTTLLHRLLAQDPDNRAPLYWETIAPFPTGERDTPERRKRNVSAMLRLAHFYAPALKAKHEVAVALPEECNELLANSLVGGFWLSRSSEFAAWLRATDKTPAYRLHKIQLQYLQRHSPRRTWVLKAPSHVNNMNWLHRVYPDARIIHLHRDPAEVVGSMASLFYSLSCLAFSRPDAHESGALVFQYIKETSCLGFNSRQGRMQYRDSGLRIADVRYCDLMSDPVGVIERIYSRFGRRLSEAARTRMMGYSRDNARHKHGVHEYSLERFGLDRSVVREGCAAYMEEYLARPEISPF